MEIAFYMLAGAVTALAILGIVTAVVVTLVSKPLMVAVMRVGASLDVPGARADGEFSLEAANDQFYDLVNSTIDRTIPSSSGKASPEARNRLSTELEFTGSWANEDPRDGFQGPSGSEKGHFSLPTGAAPPRCSFCDRARAGLRRALGLPRRASLHTDSADRPEPKKRKSRLTRGD